MDFVDLFCGVGGFRIALEADGHHCVFSCDNDSKAQDLYYVNFGDRPAGDITQISANDIPSHDILCGGFPCQTFSTAGKQEGLTGSRGQLFFEIIRIAKHHKPRLILLENVRNILSIHGGMVIRTIKRKLQEIGYNVYFNLLNSSLYGIPQARYRVYFVCLRNDISADYTPPEPTYDEVYLDDILLPDYDCHHLVIDREDMWYSTEPQKRALRPILLGHINKRRQGERIYHPMGHSVTITGTSGGTGRATGLYLINGKVRKLHIQECKRLMGFPTSHIVSLGRPGYQQLGNAVIPSMVSRVFRGVTGL